MLKKPKKPVEPKRGVGIIISTTLYESTTLQSIIDWANKNNITNLKEVKFKRYYNIFEAKTTESIEGFNQRLSQYTTELEKYNKWMEDNKEALEKEANEKAARAKIAKEKKEIAEIKAIEKELKNKTKRLEELKANNSSLNAP